jgi:hypothetical protein
MYCSLFYLDEKKVYDKVVKLWQAVIGRGLYASSAPPFPGRGRMLLLPPAPFHAPRDAQLPVHRR